MKVAFIVSKLNKTAPNFYILNIILGLKNKIEFEIFYFDNILELEFPCKINKLNFYKQYDFNKFDFIHSHGFRADIYAYKIKYFKGKKISTVHSYIHFDLRSQFNSFISFVASKIWLFVLNRFDYLITLTNDMKKYYSQYLNNPKIYFIYSGHQIPKSTSILSVNDKEHIFDFKGNDLLLCTIANLTSQKGINQTINLIAKNPKLKFLIIGEGKEKTNLINLAINNKCIDRCMFLGHKNNAWEFLKLIDVFVMSSYQEGFGLVNLEAGLMKKPILCSNISVFKEIFPDDCVSFFELNNIKSMENSLNNLMINYKLFSNNLFHLVNSQYNLQIMNDNYFDLYSKQFVKSQ